MIYATEGTVHGAVDITSSKTTEERAKRSSSGVVGRA
jgi:hypothetical protein